MFLWNILCEIYNSKYRSWKIKFLYFLFNEKYNLTKKYKILQKIWKILEKYGIVNKRDGGGEIYFDNVLIRKDGRFVLPELECLNPENLI